MGCTVFFRKHIKPLDILVRGVHASLGWRPWLPGWSTVTSHRSFLTWSFLDAMSLLLALKKLNCSPWGGTAPLLVISPMLWTAKETSSYWGSQPCSQHSPLVLPGSIETRGLQGCPLVGSWVSACAPALQLWGYCPYRREQPIEVNCTPKLGLNKLWNAQ